MQKKLFRLTMLMMVFALVLAACGTQPAAETAAPQPAAPTTEPAAPAASDEPFIFGMLHVGPYNDRGWSQAHHEGGEYVEKNVPGTKLIYIDKVNPADRAGTTPAQLAEELASQGAKLIIFNSDDMKDGALEFAKSHPEVIVIHASGDSAWEEGAAYKGLPNLGNIMVNMEYGKAISGCAAAMTTETGKIGYVGPLINEETRRYTAASYLGAKYCWEKYRGKDPADLEFKVTWIGFWFNIPGVTSDPTQVTNEFFNSGYDVAISGIDTTEVVTEARKRAAEGMKVWAAPYDYIGACEEGPEICLGVPYYNWGPSYAEAVRQAKDGTWKPSFLIPGPDWSNINNPDTSAMGFLKGDALSADATTAVDSFIAELAGGLELFTGPLNYQDGTPFLADGEVATFKQIWYLPQLLEGMEGQSVSQ